LRQVVIIIIAASVLCGCWSEQEVTGSTNSCATAMYPKFNPKVMEQCVNVCIKCERGNVTTCSTSCSLKGAH